MSVNRMSTMRYGAHANINDLTSTPGTLIFLKPDDIQGLKPGERNKIEEPVIDEFNYNNRSLPGNQNLEARQFSIEARGAAGTGVEALASATSIALGKLLESVFGNVTDASSTGSTVSSATTTAVTVASGTNYANGMICMFNVGGGILEARRITVSGNVLTVDRPLSAAPAASTQVWRSVRYQAATDAPMRIPIYIDAELRNVWRNILFGCTPAACSLSIANGERAIWTFSFVPNKFDATQANANPSVTLPSDGSTIKGTNSQLWIGDTGFMVRDVSVEFGITHTPREAQYLGSEGIYAGTVDMQDPIISATVYQYGTVQAITGGIQQNTGTVTAENLKDGGAKDVFLQVGMTRGAWMAVHMSGADCISAENVPANNVPAIKLQFKASRIAGSNNYPCAVAIG